MEAFKNIMNPSGGPGGTPPILGGNDPGMPGGSVGGFPNPGSGPGGIISKILPYILGGSGIMGTIGNIQANRTRNSVLKQQMDYTRMLQNMTPAEMIKQITALERPLSQNLISNVGNTVQGQLGERGLSQAPGIYASSLAQGIAPYQLQEQQMAQDAFFKKLGLPISSRPSPFGPFPATTNTSSIWQSLMQNFMGRGKNQVPGGVPGGDSITADLLQQIMGGQLSGLTPAPAGSGGTNNLNPEGS